MNNSVKITFLGTGTSQGVPVISCQCKVCKSLDKRDNRLRASLLAEINGKAFVIDTGPDFRQQMLNNHVDDITAILFTHEHKDHVAGLDDVRPYNFIHNKAITAFAEKRVQEALRREYAYIFTDDQYPGAPKIDMCLLENKQFTIEGVEIMPIRAYHYKLPIFGFRIGEMAYLTDIKTISDSEISKMIGVSVLVVNALRKEEHISHMNLKEALALIGKVKPERAYLTHLSHKFGLHKEEELKLPSGVHIAYDGLVVTV
jgi:phosphoribosyl 1,2-cyclic phosphate phosphodiesterase